MDEKLRSWIRQGQEIGARYALAMPRRVPLGLAGAQVGQRAGSSLEFKDHREYQPGDDLRRIDWSAYARSDKLTIKLYREEVNPHLELLIDGSASMNVPGSVKAEAALALAAAMVSAADNSSYTHGAWLGGDGCHPIANGAASPLLWDGIEFTDTHPLDESVQKLPPAWRPHSIRVLISDLLWMADPTAVLQNMAQNAAVVVVLQVLGQGDADPPQRGNLRLVDSESGETQEVFVDATAQKRYRDALTRHQTNWNRAATQVGATMTTLVAEQLLEHWNLEDLIAAEVLRVT